MMRAARQIKTKMTFKLAAITDEISEDLDEALGVMAQYGIVAAELRSAYGKNIATMMPTDIENMRRVLDRRGAHAIGIASPFYKTFLAGFDADQPTGALHGAQAVGFDDQIALLRRCIAAAKSLGAQMVRTFTFWKSAPLTEQIEDGIVEAYALPAKIAEDAGVTLILENEHSCFTGTGVDTARIAERIGSPAVRIVWDPGNAVFAGEQAFPDGYEAVKPYLAHVHLKDAARTGDAGEAKWVAVGAGAVNWPAQLAALKTDGYDGYLSLETHYASGKGKEASSRECLDAVQKLLENL